MKSKKQLKTALKSIRFTSAQIKLCDALDLDIAKICRDAIDSEITKSIGSRGAPLLAIAKILKES